MLKLEQTLKQTQQLSIQQTQSLKILAMNITTVQTLLENEQLENPLFELDETKLQQQNESILDIARYFEQTDYAVNNGVYEENSIMEQPLTTNSYTWREQLNEQLYSTHQGTQQIALVEQLILLLDTRGFLSYTKKELQQELHCKPDTLQTALQTLRSFEPFGVGCYDMGEYLILQLKESGVLNDTIEAICKQYLPLLGENNYKQIADELGVDVKTVRAYAKQIRNLHPYPIFSQTEHSVVEYIDSDSFVTIIDGELIVKLNNRYENSIVIGKSYQYYKKLTTTKEVQAYLQQKLERAKLIAIAVEQRNKTLLQVTEQIATLQSDFFFGGMIQPLSMKTIAENLSVHESTVSRAMKNKYLQCNKGVFPYSYFISSAVETTEGTDTSKEQVKQQIQQIIENEDKSHPLSDAKIESILKENGIQISRRTVTKYRLELGVLNACDRKL